jgi:hypothetical protein
MLGLRRVVGPSLLTAALSACGFLSGLDGLTLADGGADGSEDSNVADAGDADALVSPDQACEYDGAQYKGCFGMPCTGNQGCCVHPSSVECASACVGLLVQCTTQSDCSDGGVCCVQGVTRAPGVTCPAVAELGGSVATQQTTSCVPSGMCGQGGVTGVRLCSTESDCTSTTHCDAIELGDSGIVVGACL